MKLLHTIFTLSFLASLHLVTAGRDLGREELQSEGIVAPHQKQAYQKRGGQGAVPLDVQVQVQVHVVDAAEGQDKGGLRGNTVDARNGATQSWEACVMEIGGDDNPRGEKRSSKARAKTDHLRQTCDDSNDIDIRLGDGRTMKFHKGRSMRPGRRRSDSMGYWYGTDEVGNSLNLVRGKNGLVHGSFTDMEAGTVQQLGVDAEGNQVVTITPSDMFPPEEDPVEPDFHSRTLHKSTGASEARLVSSHEISGGGLRGLHENLDRQTRMLGDDSGGNLDVMVLWTEKAECRQSGQAQGCAVSDATWDSMQALVELAVEETNTAYMNSGIETELNLVWSGRLTNYVEPSFSEALDDLTFDMSSVHSLRDEVGADIVSMLIDSDGCGLGWLGPRADLMFSVTGWNCATGQYSFGHEIGHNLGLNHDRGTKNECSISGQNYGYRDPGAGFRTIMAYNCQAGQCDSNAGASCSRVQAFSNVGYTYNGKNLGESWANGAAHVNAVKGTVAGYRQHKG